MTSGPLLLAAFRSELPVMGRGLVVGVGARHLATLAPCDAKAVVMVGACGALAADLPVGSLVLVEAVVDGEGQVHAADASLVEALAEAALSARVHVERVRLLSLGSLIDVPADRASWAARTGARAVDMEALSVARWALASGRSWAILRFVTDSPAEPLTWLATFLGQLPQEEPGLLHVGLAALRRPWFVPRLLRLGLVVRRGRVLTARILRQLG